MLVVWSKHSWEQTEVQLLAQAVLRSRRTLALWQAGQTASSSQGQGRQIQLSLHQFKVQFSREKCNLYEGENQAQTKHWSIIERKMYGLVESQLMVTFVLPRQAHLRCTTNGRLRQLRIYNNIKSTCTWPTFSIRETQPSLIPGDQSLVI